MTAEEEIEHVIKALPPNNCKTQGHVHGIQEEPYEIGQPGAAWDE